MMENNLFHPQIPTTKKKVSLKVMLPFVDYSNLVFFGLSSEEFRGRSTYLIDLIIDTTGFFFLMGNFRKEK